MPTIAITEPPLTISLLSLSKEELLMQCYAKAAIVYAGGPGELARTIATKDDTLTSQGVSQWLKVPGDRVLAVEKAISGAVTRYQMRPKIFGEQP